jgi:16S rRNA (cytosine967-C5)-methyltransferase
MASTALAQHAAHLLSLVDAEHPADAVLREHVGADRELDPSDKRALSAAVFAYYRWFRWLDPQATPTRNVLAALELQTRFDADPRKVKSEELCRLTLPDWAYSELVFPQPEAELAFARQLQSTPALWLRPQRAFSASMPRALRHTAPPPASCSELALSPAPTALRYTGPNDLFQSDEFKKGLFEIQDLASQLVSHACAPRAGQTWWDACAGEGGKTLHLGDLMDNKGLLWASDRHTGRLARLRKRAARAQVFNYRAVVWNGGPILPTKTKFDGILLDAPCSGLGTWQRNPHARWSTTLADMHELAEVQQSLLFNVARALKPGGRLVYAVCTLTRRETEAVANAFDAAHPDFTPCPVFGEHGDTRRYLWPHAYEANGMFIATWRKKA